MFPVGNSQSILKTFLINEVGQNKCSATSFHYIRQIFQCKTDISTTAFRLKVNQFTNDI